MKQNGLASYQPRRDSLTALKYKHSNLWEDYKQTEALYSTNRGLDSPASRAAGLESYI